MAFKRVIIWRVGPLSWLLDAMRIIATICLLLAFSAAVYMATKFELISGSFGLGFQADDALLTQSLQEIRDFKDPEELRSAADTYARMEDRSSKYMARYIVYFFSAIGALIITLLILAYFVLRCRHLTTQSSGTSE